ncbi:hypothetical protein ABW19_dt0200943 [Dactylella cylindrospora]|nr:hypothetical protein ABW19_dt0200943 [Dactylella cylindrospora]
MQFDSLLKICQKPPSTLLLPSFLLPIICRLGKQLNHIIAAPIMRRKHKYILIRVERLQLADHLLCFLNACRNRPLWNDVEGGAAGISACRKGMDFVENLTGTGIRMKADKINNGWKRGVPIRTELGSVME